MIAVLACGPESVGDGRSGLLEGVTLVDLGPLHDIPVLPWHLDLAPSFRAAGATERSNHEFVEVSAAAVRSDGSVVIADARTGLVRLYDPEGEYLAQFGAPGEGPGEFRSPSSVVTVRGDSTWIWDRRLWRTSLFGPDTEFVRSERYDPSDADLYPVRGMWPESVDLMADGSRVVTLAGKGAPKGAASEGVDSVGVAVHRAEAANLDLIAVLPPEDRVTVPAPWGTATIAPPLAAGPVSAAARDGGRICVGHQARPEVLCSDRSGERLGARWTGPPRAAKRGDPAIAHWREEMTLAYSTKLSEPEVREMLAHVPNPQTLPRFRDLTVDPLGYLWVELGPSRQQEGHLEFLVLTRELGVVGRLELPSMRVLGIGSDHVLAVRQDALGLEEVLVLRLDRSSSE